MPVEPGRSGRAELTVADADTAIAMGSGDVPVLATPRVIALCEQASVQAVADALGPGQTTVGMRVMVDHVAPTSVGTTVRADAILEEAEGRRLTFKVSVSDRRGLVAAGRVTRVIVDVDHFLEKTR